METNRCFNFVDEYQPKKGNEVGDFIRTSAKELRFLNASTEEDFLSVGACLQQLSSQSQAVSKTAGSVVGLVTGKGVESGTNTLKDIEGLMSNYFREAQSKFECYSSSLLRMLSLVETTYRPLSTFKTIVKHLHMLGISTRIEDARLDSDGNFNTLTDDVERLSAVVASKTEEILNALASLHEIMGQVLPGVLSTKDAVTDGTQDMLRRVASSLSTLLEKRASSAQTAVRLTVTSEEMISKISEVISSLQFHDITRQQIEHVIQLFDEIAARGSTNDIVDVLGKIGHLQINQLDHARKEMCLAVGRIIDDLRGIARHLSEMLKETETLIGVAGKEDSSFLTDLDNSMAFVMSSLNQNVETDAELAGAVSHVSRSIRNVSAFVNDIEEMASEIELIAINAQIKAASMAEGCGALGVLAGAIRTLSDNTRNQAAEMTRALENVEAAAMELDTACENRGGEREIAHIMAEMKSLIGSLGESRERLSSLLSQLKSQTGKLTETVESVITGVSAHRRTDETVGGIIKNLQRIVGQKEPDPPSQTGNDVDYLALLSSRYTMQQERFLHQAYVNPINGTPPVVDEMSFADNVELF